MEASRSAIGAADASQKTNTLRMALDKEKRDVTKAGEATSDHVLNQAVARHGMNKGGATGRWINKTNPKDVIPVRLDSSNNPMTQNPDTGKWDIPVDATQFVPEDKYANRGGGYKGVAMNTIQQGKLEEEFGTAMKIGEIAGKYENRFGQIGEIPTKYGNKLIHKMQANDLLDIVASGEFTQDARDAAQWWADWRLNYTGPMRHKYFVLP